MSDQHQRLENVNAFMQVIGDHGRNFFKHKDRYASMEVDHRGRVWFIDDYTQDRIYTHYRWRWRGFSHGGTMRNLVELFRDHIKKGRCMNPRYFDPQKLSCSGHIWGYPAEEMARVKAEGIRLGIVNSQVDEDAIERVEQSQ